MKKDKVVDIRRPRKTLAAPKDVAVREDGTREPWNGNLSEDELGRPGGLLLAALVQCATERNELFKDMAASLGVTYGYISQLRSGIRETSLISDDFANSCAEYLGVPRLTVLFLAGRISPKDFFESEQAMQLQITRAFRYVCDDPSWGPLVTREIRGTSLDSKYLVVRLYEQATGTTLMPEHVNVKEMAAEFAKLEPAVARATPDANRHPTPQRSQ